MLENELLLSPQQWRILSQKIIRIKCLFKEDPTSADLVDALDDLEKLIQEDQADAGALLSAQLSLYPLRQASLSPCINGALSILNQTGLDTFPGSMSTVISGTAEKLWTGLQQAFSAAAAHGELVMIVTISNACPKPGD